MAKLNNPAAAGMIDMGNNFVAYVDGIGDIDQVGPNSHLVFYMLQKLDERTRRMVVARLIVPTAELARMARQLANPTAAIDGPAANFENPMTGESLLH
jgi:hypothetical protein